MAKEVGYIWENACPQCGDDLILKDSKYDIFYGCVNWPDCTGKCCVHKYGDQRGEPMGYPADEETREWRMRAHKAFDMLWKGDTKIMSRAEAYRRMQAWMSKTEEQAHIAKFSILECERLTKAVINHYEYLKEQGN